MSRCPAGHEALWGSLATAADVAAWEAEHAGCAPRAEEPRGVRIRLPTVEEAIEIARLLRPTHVVGRVGCGLFARPR